MLTDAGPLVALADPDEPAHAACRAHARTLPELLTTWPCFTEAMHLLGRFGRRHRRDRLWLMVGSGHVRFHRPGDAEIGKMRELMDKYADRPMDLADASLVAAAGALGRREVFSLDADFQIYRPPAGGAFAVHPA